MGRVLRYFVLLSTAFISIIAKVVQFHHLRDSRLCNNGNLAGYNSTLCKSRPEPEMNVGEEYVCDTRIIKPEECREAAVELDVFTNAKLMELIPSIDTDNSIRRIVIKMDKDDIDIAAVGKEIDAFLTTRLWWYVLKEPHQWNKHSHKVIVFDRFQHENEPYLRVLSALQYPLSASVCAKSPLLFNHRDFNHPGWYSMLAVYSIVHSELPYAITALYVSTENSVNDSAAFISGADCPSVVNKWECAFLPTTNCALPTVITHCKGHNCVQDVVADTRWSTAIFDSASPTGKVLRADTPEYAVVKGLASKAPQYNPHYMEVAAAAARVPSARVKYIKPFSTALAPFQSMMRFDMDMYTYNLILRPSAYYRSRIAETIKDFRAAHNFSSTDRCVAAQVRRGDRAMKGVNITDYCLNTPNPNTDMGCDNVPFASVTLQHVVDSAAKLVDPSVRTLIVSTDDEDWLNASREQLRKTRPDWKVLNLKAPSKKAEGAGEGGDPYDYMRFRAGTASGVLLHGSIELSRQCEAFVGHFGCGGTMLVYKSLCAQHNHREYICPPSFDVRTIPELRIH